LSRRLVPALLPVLAVGASAPVAEMRDAAPQAPPQAAACAERAAALPAPEGLQSATGRTASPASPFRFARPWAPPHPAAEDAAAKASAAGQPATAQRLSRLAKQPRGIWLDEGTPASRLTADVAAMVEATGRDGAVPVFVAYAIPLRDCGDASEGGHASAADYLAWIDALATGLEHGRAAGGHASAVVLEPDAVAQLDRLPEDRRSERLALLRAATARLSAVPGTAVYIDAGHSDWIGAAEMAQRLAKAGVGLARGFSVNVSGFGRTRDEAAYARRIAPLVGWKHFVVDTGRNGAGPPRGGDQAWCNPTGRALGVAPEVAPAELVDALLWIKPPGESDGACLPGQPDAGTFWPEYAADLAARAGW
jgi:endoglucanase